MNPTIWAAVLGAVAALAISGAGFLVAWGSMRATVIALAVRVTAVEAELGSVNAVKVSIGRLEEGFGAFKEQFRELNASIRWMRDPAQAPARGAARRKKP
jgi:hypothetical protein